MNDTRRDDLSELLAEACALVSDMLPLAALDLEGDLKILHAVLVAAMFSSFSRHHH